MIRLLHTQHILSQSNIRDFQRRSADNRRSSLETRTKGTPKTLLAQHSPIRGAQGCGRLTRRGLLNHNTGTGGEDPLHDWARAVMRPIIQITTAAAVHELPSVASRSGAWVLLTRGCHDRVAFRFRISVSCRRYGVSGRPHTRNCCVVLI